MTLPAINPWIRLGAIALCGALSATAAAADASYPAHEIRFIVPWAPGGSTDIVGRALQHLAAKDGYTLVVENLAGASGSIGLAKVARSPADGYTLGLGTTSTLVLHTQGITDLRPDQFTTIASASIDPMVLVVPKDGPATVEAFLDNMKKNPGKVSIGTSGANNISHLFAVMTSRAAQVPFIHVPYTGGSRVVTDLGGHQITAGILKPSESKAQMDAGIIKPLAVYAEERLSFMPDVPTFKEKGYDVFPYGQVTQASYVVTPAGIPEPIRQKLVAEFRKIIQSDEFQSFARQNGFFVEDSTGTKLQKEIADMQTSFDKMGTQIFNTSK
ncbi:MAG TPA: tripartite tricarboxylate transporter substrate binding protein [Bordetella sp.]|jgi:tripartite-type tricarboxylate transporter receptor subunit TctC|nr:tripartite tricarboxylate transporter substrate binding protein [Bordetella sp.]